MECQRDGSGLCSCGNMVGRLLRSWHRILRESRMAFGYFCFFQKKRVRPGRVMPDTRMKRTEGIRCRGPPGAPSAVRVLGLTRPHSVRLGYRWRQETRPRSETNTRPRPKGPGMCPMDGWFARSQGHAYLCRYCTSRSAWKECARSEDKPSALTFARESTEDTRE